MAFSLVWECFICCSFSWSLACGVTWSRPQSGTDLQIKTHMCGVRCKQGNKRTGTNVLLLFCFVYELTSPVDSTCLRFPPSAVTPMCVMVSVAAAQSYTSLSLTPCHISNNFFSTVMPQKWTSTDGNTQTNTRGGIRVHAVPAPAIEIGDSCAWL